MARFKACRRWGGYIIEGQLLPFLRAEYQFKFSADEKLVGWRAIPFSAKATRWQMRWRHLSPDPWQYSDILPDETIILDPAPPPGDYEGQAAWWDEEQRLSAWSESNMTHVP